MRMGSKHVSEIELPVLLFYTVQNLYCYVNGDMTNYNSPGHLSDKFIPGIKLDALLGCLYYMEKRYTPTTPVLDFLAL